MSVANSNSSSRRYSGNWSEAGDIGVPHECGGCLRLFDTDAALRDWQSAYGVHGASQAVEMRSETRTLEWFLNDPRCRKWIIQCSSCGAYGRKHGAPPTVPKYRFEEMFPVMNLDEESGQCEQCREADGRGRR